MSYSGSARRILRLRRRARSPRTLAAVTVLAIVLVVIAWWTITLWYLIWGFWLVPYRLLRRGDRKRRVEALRHRELLGTIQGSAAASAAVIVSGQAADLQRRNAPAVDVRVDSQQRERAARSLGEHFVAGRLSEDELHERLARAYGATMQSDLDAVLGDLPPAAGS